MAAIFITERGYRFEVSEEKLIYRGFANGPLGKAEHINMVQFFFQRYKAKQAQPSYLQTELRDNRLAAGFAKAVDGLVISLNPEYLYTQQAA